MIEVPYLPAAVNGLEKDRSGRFIAVGVLLLVVAAGFGCISALAPFSMAMNGTYQTAPATQASNGNRPVAPTAASMLLGTAIVFGVAVLTAWVGVGALLKRRWARPLVLVLGTHAVIAGAATFLATLITLPIEAENLALTTGNTSAAYVGVALGALFILLGLVVLPTVLLVLMSPDEVRLTAEHYDLRPRWTDGLPLKVVGLVITLFVVGASEAFAMIRPHVPLVRLMLTGWPARALLLIDICAVFWAMALVYRRQMLGWTVGFWSVLVPFLLAIISAPFMPVSAYLDTPELAAALAGAQRHQALFRASTSVGVLIFAGAFVVYMYRVRPLLIGSAATAHTQ